jgi:hypothetical protein
MIQATADRIYHLLPAVYRLRDAEQGGETLRALLAIIESELAAIERDIGGLYDNWFIETCAEWVVPYVGDLLDAPALNNVGATASRRAWVANTIRNRRRKGTIITLQQLARDVTGWPARAVEFFQLLATTQHLNHVRRANVRTPDLRDTASLELLATPFEQVAHTAEVRSISLGRGKYNVLNVGIFLWRLQPYPIERVTPAAATGTPAGCYYFNPLGKNLPLFNQPQTTAELKQLAGERDVPGMLRRRPLYDELEALRAALASGAPAPELTYFGINPVLRVFIDDPQVPVKFEEILVCNLDGWEKPGWKNPPGTRTYPGSNGTPKNLPITVAVDPALGRLALPTGSPHIVSAVDHTYAFVSDMGGGPYDRRDSLATWLDPLKDPPTWQRGVSSDQATLASAPDPTQIVKSLAIAASQWKTFANAHPGAFGVIALMENRTLNESGVSIEVPVGTTLAIVAAQWPALDTAGAPGMPTRIPGRIVADALRPHIHGDLSVTGTAGPAGMSGGTLILDGVLHEGTLWVLPGDLGALRFRHSTLVPTLGRGLFIASGTPRNDRLVVTVDHSICGMVNLADLASGLTVADSIIDGGISAWGMPASFQRATVIGSSYAKRLEAGNSIFTGVVEVSRRQDGCVRFSALPAESQTPRRFRCQPDLALRTETDSAKQASIKARMVPIFTSDRFGDPAYCQLAPACAVEIRTGSEDGSAMGAFSSLHEPQREANLQAGLAEYLRFGLEAGSFYVT